MRFGPFLEDMGAIQPRASSIQRAPFSTDNVAESNNAMLLLRKLETINQKVWNNLDQGRIDAIQFVRCVEYRTSSGELLDIAPPLDESFARNSLKQSVTKTVKNPKAALVSFRNFPGSNRFTSGEKPRMSDNQKANLKWPDQTSFLDGWFQTNNEGAQKSRSLAF